MIKLGNEVRDIVTGFVGIATSRVEYINGCIQYCVVPKVGEDGKMTVGEYIDTHQLVETGSFVKMESEPTGGFQRDCPKH